MDGWLAEFEGSTHKPKAVWEAPKVRRENTWAGQLDVGGEGLRWKTSQTGESLEKGQAKPHCDGDGDDDVKEEEKAP